MMFIFEEISISSWIGEYTLRLFEVRASCEFVPLSPEGTSWEKKSATIA